MRAVDDLTLIRGIGPSIQKRLRVARIRTFAQLAQRSPTELEALVPGLSTQRHRLADWIEEADRLARHTPRPETVEAPAGGPGVGPEPERRRDSGSLRNEERTAGYEAHLAGDLRVREVEMIVGGHVVPLGVIQQGQPFALRTVLDLHDLVDRGDRQLSYRLVVVATGLLTGQRNVLGEDAGLVPERATKVPVSVEALGLTPDLYRLTASVVVGAVRADASAALSASLEIGALQII